MSRGSEGGLLSKCRAVNRECRLPASWTAGPPVCSGPVWCEFQNTHLTPLELLEDCSPGREGHSTVAGTRSWRSPRRPW